MEKYAVWHATASGAERLDRAGNTAGARLVDWLESAPDIVEPDLVVVGRQARLDGSTADLLGVDRERRWVVVAVRQGVVRREAFARALECTACLATTDRRQLLAVVHEYIVYNKDDCAAARRIYRELVEQLQNDREQLQVRGIVVGTEIEPDAERLLSYLSGSNALRIGLVLLDVLAMPDGGRLIIRPNADKKPTDGKVEVREVEPERTVPPDVERVLAKADLLGWGNEFRTVYRAAIRHGLRVKAYPDCLAYGMPGQKAFFYTVLPDYMPCDRIVFSFKLQQFIDYYALDPRITVPVLARKSGGKLKRHQVGPFVESLDRIYLYIRSRKASD